MEAALNGPFGHIALGSAVLTIGRVQDNQLVISDPKASSRHAEIRPNGQGYLLVDLGSTNGTFVNGQQLAPNTPHELNPGDDIRIGETSFKYETSGSGIEPTIYASSGSGGYQPTIMAPPSEPAYGASARSDYAAPPPAQPSYSAPPSPPPYGGYQSAPPPYNPPPAAVPPLPGAGYGQVPNYAAPPQQQKSRRGLWITLGIIGGLLLLVCVACGGFTLYAASLVTPAKTLDTFCSNLVAGDTHTAYSHFSTSLKAQIPEAEFTRLLAADKISSCTHGTPDESSNSATTTLKLVHASGTTNNDTVGLIKEDDEWKINDIRSS